MMAENRSEKSVGHILKEARVVKNITLEEASRNTKIHINILKSIESDAVDDVGSVYAKSFIKLYAEFLGLNKEELIQRFQRPKSKSETPVFRKTEPVVQEHPAKTTASKEKPVERAFSFLTKMDYKLVLVVVAGLFVLVGLVRLIGRHGRPSGRTPDKAEVSGFQERELKGKRSVEAEERAVVVPASPQKKSPPAEADVTKEEEIVLTILAKEKCWLQVKADSEIVFENVLAKGVAETWQAKDKIELLLGNAGGVELELNGKHLGQIGRSGQMLKNVVVTKSGLSIEE